MMYIENIRIQDGRVRNIAYHDARCNSTRKAIYGSTKAIYLRNHIACPAELSIGTTKCRITYAEQIIKVEYEPYKVKPISSLQLIEADHVQYQHKGSERLALSDLFAQRGCSDDIIMVKNGLLTDTFYGNIAMLKNGRWYTPQTPMLEGTMRAHLLDKGRVKTTIIAVADIRQYKMLTIFNAMIPMGKMLVQIDDIISK